MFFLRMSFSRTGDIWSKYGNWVETEGGLMNVSITSMFGHMFKYNNISINSKNQSQNQVQL